MNIILGVTGGIAAYKVADVASVLTRDDSVDGKVQFANTVKIVMTENAKKFVTPLTLSTMSKNPVYDDASEWAPDGVIKHIELSKWANILVIVPATANTIMKIAQGVADNLLTSLYLAFKGKVLIFPAMNTKMWDHPATEENLRILNKRKDHFIIPPEEGLLACGDWGMGKLPSVKTIVRAIRS